MSSREKIQAAALEAAQLAAENKNESRDWWLSRQRALEYALEAIE